MYLYMSYVVTDLSHVYLQEEQLQSKHRELGQAQQQLRQKVQYVMVEFSHVCVL